MEERWRKEMGWDKGRTWATIDIDTPTYGLGVVAWDGVDFYKRGMLSADKSKKMGSYKNLWIYYKYTNGNYDKHNEYEVKSDTGLSVNMANI